MNEYRVTVTARYNGGFLPDFNPFRKTFYEKGESESELEDRVRSKFMSTIGYAPSVSLSIDIERV